LTDVSEQQRKLIQDQDFQDNLITSFICFLLTQPGESQQKEFHHTQRKALKLLSEFLRHTQKSAMSPVVDLVDLLIDLSRTHTSEVVVVINQLAESESVDVSDAIKVLLSTVQRVHHESLIQSLLRYHNQDSNELLFYLSRYLETEEATKKIDLIIQHVSALNLPNHPSLLTLIDRLLM
jgi:hypothetical protein